MCLRNMRITSVWKDVCETYEFSAQFHGGDVASTFIRLSLPHDVCIFVFAQSSRRNNFTEVDWQTIMKQILDEMPMRRLWGRYSVSDLAVWYASGRYSIWR